MVAQILVPHLIVTVLLIHQGIKTRDAHAQALIIIIIINPKGANGFVHTQKGMNAAVKKLGVGNDITGTGDVIGMAFQTSAQPQK